MTKEERSYFYRSFAAGVRKARRVERKMKKKVKEAFTHLMLCATL
jgi:hypothetical protein